MLPIPYQLAILLNLLTSNYFSNINCIFSISDEHLPLFVPIPQILLAANENLREHFLGALENHCEAFIIQSRKSAEIFETIEGTLKESLDYLTRYNKRRYLMVGGNISQVFEMEAMRFVADFVMVQEVVGGYGLWTNDYGSWRDGPVLLDIWFSGNMSFLHGTDLYPDKFMDQKGRILRMSGVFPYDSANVEWEVVKEYARRYNLTQEFVVLPQGNWGDTYINYTGTGLKGMLLRDETDVSAGYMYLDLYKWRFHDIPHSLVRIGITCLVPRPSLISAWYIIKYTFSYKVWICYIIAYGVLGSIFTYFLSHEKIFTKGYRPGTAFYYIIAIFLEQSSIPSHFITTKLRMVLAATCMFVLIYNVAFSSRLSSLLVAPRYTDEINNIADLYRSKIDWGNYNNSTIDPIRQSIQYKKMIDRFRTLKLIDIEKRMVAKEFALVIDRKQVSQRLKKQFSPEFSEKIIRKYKIMRDDLFGITSVTLMRKNCVFMESFNKMVLRTFDAGINLYWDMKVSLEHRQLETIMKSASITDDSVKKLNLSQVMDIFLILSIGYVVSIAVFAIEYCGKCQECLFKMHK